ncbi:hypothetical protein HNO52_11665 [Billgrantia diversa]|uniref:hypothetical protein n=1 Tax=Halomonas sp. MCCC 1A13316 TaxID=2733487 RepID=UPI0018A52712|nr:hypothetical protein [Halomonas sp. MCCC 1A13316]QOR39098.1 hypothetical protein HNO52_11665 [Halomonas sp. MCCC 1A13316]
MFWKLMPCHAVRDIDLPFIESPTLASSKVKDKLSREPGREGLSQLYAKAGGCGVLPDREVAIRTIVKAVKQGTLLLVLNDGFDRPFLPLVEWNGKQWRSNAHWAFSTSGLVDSLLPRLNARG